MQSVRIPKVPDYVWPDDNEKFGGCEAIILDLIDGRLFQINASDIVRIDILE